MKSSFTPSSSRLWWHFLEVLFRVCPLNGLKKGFSLGRVELNMCPVHYSTYREGGKSFMIMDNLKALGYAIPPAVATGMDFIRCKVLLEELGRQHAAFHAFVGWVQDTGAGPVKAVDFLKKDFLHKDADKVGLTAKYPDRHCRLISF